MTSDAVDAVTAAIEKLFRLGASRRIFAQQVSAAGAALTPQGLRVLERTVEAGETSPGELAAMLDLDPATVTRLVRQLEAARMIVRSKRHDDRRFSSVSPTEEGAAVLQRYRTVIWEQVRRALSDWPKGDIDTLATLTGRLVDDLQKEPYRPPLSSPTG